MLLTIAQKFTSDKTDVNTLQKKQRERATGKPAALLKEEFYEKISKIRNKLY